MNDKQRVIVETFGQGLSVVAGAGCGKTTTLVAKCAELLRQNPKARFCAVSFTEKSVRDLKESLREKLGGVDLQDHWVKTIHGLCASILHEFPVAAGLQGGERILLEDEANRLWSKSLDVLWSSNDNEEISQALERLLLVYSRDSLESLLRKLRSLMSFGVEEFVPKSFDRIEVRDLWLVFESVYQRYQQAKNRDGGLDFNDLELRADRALLDERVRNYFHSRFDLVMVDEFQDTNPLQGRILERFVKEGLTNLCIVGDPKQSIYRFRDADVSVFQDLTARLPSKHILDENYRSRPPILDFVNQVCEPAFRASNLPYEPLIAKREALEPDAVSILEWTEEADLAQYLLSERSRGVELSEFVILARSVRNPKTQKFLQNLEAHGIPILLGSGGRFYEDPRVLEIIALLRGWVSTENTLSQVTALRAPWIGVSDSWLVQTKSSFFQKFFESSDHPIARGLKTLYLSSGRTAVVRPGQILAELLKVESLDEELYVPIVSLWHKVEEWSRQGLRFESVVRQLTDAVENEKIEKEVPAPAEKGMVRVMTVHGSKGLQFPRVILLDFDGPSRSSTRSGDLIWDRKLGVHLLHRDEDGVTVEDDSENVKWKELERQAAIAESKRVFYVALTRAQERLILVWKKDVKESKKTADPGYDPFLEDNWRAWVKATRVPNSISWERDGITLEPLLNPGSISSRPDSHGSFDSKPFRARHSPSEWLILAQCARRYRRRFSASDLEPESSEDTSGEVAQNFEPGRGKAFSAQKGERIHKLIEERRDSELIEEFGSKPIGEEIVSKLRSFLRESQGSIRSFSELAFEVPLSSKEALVGMMDRLEIDVEARSIRLIDYKFTTKPVSSDQLLSNYALQLRLYAYAALQLVPFAPNQIEGFLAHFTDGTLVIIRAPDFWFQPNLLREEVSNLFDQAKSSNDSPSPGEHCTYCEVRADCPAKL